MTRAILSRVPIFLLMVASFAIGGLLLPRFQNGLAPERIVITEVAQANTPTPSNTFPPTTPLASITPLPPTATLRPPPTLEPPTEQPSPSNTPTATATNQLVVEVTIPGLQGLETATPTGTGGGCQPRDDWKLIYEVKANDAIANIAAAYGTWTDELVEANCLTDANVIVIGQKLRVPGEVHPSTPEYDCTFKLLAPMDYAYNIDGNGTMTFSWIGPETPRNLIRVYRSNDLSRVVWEETIDLRQNHTITLANTIPEGGEFVWFVYPLDLNFKQIFCKEGGPWHFHKSGAIPTPTLGAMP
jgi:LysM repeat protein